MIVSIHQPAYLPWLGYFQRIALSDLHIVLDHVQFEKNSFTNRNKVRTATGWTWLTVPLKTKGRFGELELNRIEIVSDDKWRKKHWATLQQAYGRAPYFSDYGVTLEEFYRRPWSRLNDLLREMTAFQLTALGIETPLVFSSELTVAGSKSELVLNLCKEVGADVYLSGPLGRDYLDVATFQAAGLEVKWHDYRHPVYPQVQGGFEPYMAAVDLLFHCGAKSWAVLGREDGDAVAA